MIVLQNQGELEGVAEGEERALYGIRSEYMDTGSRRGTREAATGRGAHLGRKVVHQGISRGDDTQDRVSGSSSSHSSCYRPGVSRGGEAGGLGL